MTFYSISYTNLKNDIDYNPANSRPETSFVDLKVVNRKWKEAGIKCAEAPGEGVNGS
jgi:hypothetical protein